MWTDDERGGDVTDEQNQIGGEHQDDDLVPRSPSSPLPFEDLRAPQPITAQPPGVARWLAFGSILLGGLLGGLIGYATADLMTSGGLLSALGAIGGGAAGAAGVGVVAGLTLRAMNEWRPVAHPESDLETRPSSGLVLRRDRTPGAGSSGGAGSGPGAGGDDR
ncbi:MAG: hypothetical protein ACFCVK_25140 [Acidimicrobiales bacterium]